MMPLRLASKELGVLELVIVKPPASPPVPPRASENSQPNPPAAGMVVVPSNSRSKKSFSSQVIVIDPLVSNAPTEHWALAFVRIPPNKSAKNK
jgi:hypothetical protein